MKVLLICFRWWGSVIEDVADGFKKNNWKVIKIIYEYRYPLLLKHLYTVLKKIEYEGIFFWFKADAISEKINHIKNHNRIIQAIKKEKFDLIFIVKGETIHYRTLKYIKEHTKTPIAVWFIDDPLIQWAYPSKLRYQIYKNFQYYDKVYVFDSYYIKLLKAHFPKKDIMYLPFAVNPERYFNIEAEKEFNVSFVGDCFPNREELLFDLKKYGLKIWGTEHWEKKFNDCATCKIIDTQEANKIYNKTKVNININHNQSINGTNTRTFEVVGGRNFLINDYKKDLENLFEIGKEIETFKTKEELEEKVKYYLEHPDEAKEIARAGYKRVLEEHTFEKRIQKVIYEI